MFLTTVKLFLEWIPSMTVSLPVMEKEYFPLKPS